MRRSRPGTGPSLRPTAVAWVVLTALTAAPAALLAIEGVHAGDVLEITVAGRPDLGRLRTVGTTGTIWLPHVGEVPVAGLTPDQVGGKLTDLLARQVTNRPAVTARVVDEAVPVVQVVGAVARPGRHTLGAKRRLIDVLLAAGGFTTAASGDVSVERHEGTFPDGTALRRVHLPLGEPTPEALAALELPLARGDVVTVAAAGYVTVTGEVVKPGRFRLDGTATVTQAVSWAGGVAPRGARRASIQRRNPENGRVETLEADLDAIGKGREQDPPLLPDDAIAVGRGRL